MEHNICMARAIRQNHRITVEELSQAAGVSCQLISKIELEPERQTDRHEELLRRAFQIVIARRRNSLISLERELACCEDLFSPRMEVDVHGE